MRSRMLATPNKQVCVYSVQCTVCVRACVSAGGGGSPIQTQSLNKMSFISVLQRLKHMMLHVTD